MTTPDSSSEELDAREIAKEHRHAVIFKRFAELAVGESFVLINGHYPRHLHDEFERDHANTFDWDRLESEGDRRVFRVRITRRTSTDVPQVLGNTSELLAADLPDPQAIGTLGGAVWKLESTQRQLDSNVIRLGPDDMIKAHKGPDQDVLLHVLAGSGVITSEAGPTDLSVGSLAWLPRASHRSITAGADGMSYLSVHVRRPGLAIGLAADRP